ncbi:MAG: hypothetical protein QOF02_2545 [Blastocatellia bacterium]|nr:hypothetical protein [Blastocatellia bacterium]
MPVASHPIEAVEIFCSYAHKDEALRDELAEHLSSLKQEGKIKQWHDRMIMPGEDWKGRIDAQLETAHIILLLISSAFTNSDYCQQIEMQRAMERYRAGEARVIPVILRPCDWETLPFNEPQALPKNALPVTEWPNRDSALRDVAKGIRAVVNELLGASASAATKRAGGSKALPRIYIPRPPIIGFVARRNAEGRDIVECLREQLAPQKQSQLVTLSGPGGIGKTTLAAEAARELEKTFGGRVVWSSAEGRADFTLSTLLDDTATQLGREDLRPLPPDEKAAQVYALVAEPPALVVLDNYETIKPDAQQSIEAWFKHARCFALFTSRQGIGATFNVAIAAMSPEEAEEFLQRTITQTQDAQIFSPEIRRRIYSTAEANPFVMQWVVGQIDAAQEPQTVFEELQHGEGDAAQRVFDRSFNLPQLGDDGRATLLALSLFAPSTTRNALAEVAGFGNDSSRINEALKNLRALWLIKAIDENRRFAVEGLTRSLAAARLSKDPHAAEFRQRFVAYFLSYAEAHKQTTPEDFAALEAEKDNALNSMDAAFEMKDWDSGIRVRFALEEFLDLRGYWDEAIQQGERAIKAARSSQAEGRIADLSHNVAVIYQRRGEFDEARRLYNESLEINKRLGNQSGIASTLHQLGWLAQAQGEIEEARGLYNESLEIEKRLGNQSGIAITLHQLAMLAQDQGEVAEARRLYNESLEIEKRLGDQSGIAITLHALANVAKSQGDFVKARQLYEESLEITKRLGDKSNIGLIFCNMGALAEREGNKEEAVRLLREALGIFEKLGSPYAEMARRNLERLEGKSS